MNPKQKIPAMLVNQPYRLNSGTVKLEDTLTSTTGGDPTTTCTTVTTLTHVLQR